MKKNQKQLIVDILGSQKRPREKAIEYLYSSCFRKIESQVVFRGGSAQEARDIFQDGISIVYSNLLEDKFRGESNLETYLIGVCKNLMRGNRSRLKLVELDYSKIEYENENEAPINVELLQKGFDRLKENCKAILTGYYYEKKSIREIMITLKMNSEQVVKNQKVRCLKYLKETFNKMNVSKSDLDE